MRALIENYRNLTAEHCGSGSMRNLLYHYCQLELDEAVIFGLGAGLDCLCFSMPQASPPYMLFGRSITMEQDLATNLGVDYREQPEPDEQMAWEQVRQEVLDGNPTMLSGDIFYLDYRKFKVHFPGHRFVLLGFDDELQQVYIADRTESATQVCSMDALRLSRNPPVGISTANLWGKFRGTALNHSLPEACGLALRTTVARMQGVDQSQVDWIGMSSPGKPQFAAGGLAGIGLLAEQMQTWPDLPDAAGYAGYMVNAITKFGSGGALFRNLYSGFIDWSRQQRPDLVSSECVALARQSAQQWAALSTSMEGLAVDSQDKNLWQVAQQQVQAAHAAEYSLFGQLADRVL
jgi:hypothetical protein